MYIAASCECVRLLVSLESDIDIQLVKYKKPAEMSYRAVQDGPDIESEDSNHTYQPTDSLSPCFTAEVNPSAVFFPDHMDLSSLSSLTSTHDLETKLLRLCNKKFLTRVSLSAEEQADHEDARACPPDTATTVTKQYENMAAIWRKIGPMRNRVLSVAEAEQKAKLEAEQEEDSTHYQSPWLRSLSRSISHHIDNRSIMRRMRPGYDTSYGGNLYRTDQRYGHACVTDAIFHGGDFDEHEMCHNTEIEKLTCSNSNPREVLTDDGIKRAVAQIRTEMIKLRESDRKLLKNFIQIRFGIDYMDWSRKKTRGSCLDLAAHCTLPRSPTSRDGTMDIPFRQRARSLVTNNAGFMTIAGRGSTIKEV